MNEEHKASIDILRNETCNICNSNKDVVANLLVDYYQEYADINICIACLANMTKKVFDELEKIRVEKYERR